MSRVLEWRRASPTPNLSPSSVPEVLLFPLSFFVHLINFASEKQTEPKLEGEDSSLDQEEVDPALLKQTQTMEWMLDLLEAERVRLN